MTLPNSVVLTYDHDDAKRLTRITNAAGEKIEYTYDAMGNRTQIDTKNSGGTIVVQVRHTYDELSRHLTDLGASSQTTTYAYDKHTELQLRQPLVADILRFSHQYVKPAARSGVS